MRFIKSFPHFLIEIIIFASFAVIFLSHSFLLTDVSRLYSSALAHRLQTDALLKGHLSLSPLPFGYLLDFYWSGHGLQQSWGLGIPLLRLPFEWIAVQLGVGPFPDRLVLLFYLMLTIVMLNISIRLILADLGLSPETAAALLLRWYLVAWILFSPALGGLVQKYINKVYYETIFYGDLYTYFLLALFWIYLIKPNDRAFLILCLASGLGWLICPTQISYGLTTFVLACVCAYQNKHNASLITAGVLCLSVGVVINLWCNYLRFGSMFDFGQSENFCGIPILDYSLRFGYPFRHEPFSSAAKELAGLLFFHNPWQSDTIRFRWGSLGYNPPFNITHILIIAGGMVSCCYLSLTGLMRRFRLIFYTLVWGIVCSIVLFSFYLRLPYTNGSYLSEFSPAFNAIYISLILLSLSCLTFCFRDKRFLVLFFLALSLLFYAADGPFFKIDNRPMDNVSQGIISKSTITKVGPKGGMILRELIKRGILENISPVTVRLNPRADLKESTIFEVARRQFGIIWYILRTARYKQLNQPELTDKEGIKALVGNFNQNSLLRPSLPEISYCGHVYQTSGMMFQYEGWDMGTNCLVSAVTSALLPAKRCVSLNYRMIGPVPPVRVKRDLIFLKLVDSQMARVNAEKFNLEMTQVFCTDEPIRNTVALYSMAWTTPDQLTDLGNGTLSIQLNWIKVSDQSI